MEGYSPSRFPLALYPRVSFVRVTQGAEEPLLSSNSQRVLSKFLRCGVVALTLAGLLPNRTSAPPERVVALRFPFGVRFLTAAKQGGAPKTDSFYKPSYYPKILQKIRIRNTTRFSKNIRKIRILYCFYMGFVRLLYGFQEALQPNTSFSRSSRCNTRVLLPTSLFL